VDGRAEGCVVGVGCVRFGGDVTRREGFANEGGVDVTGVATAAACEPLVTRGR
jgi:hypothetical protein